MAAQIRNPGPPISQEQLREIEQRLGLVLPTDYGSFLLTSNGGEPSPGWIQHGDDDGDWAQITDFWSAETMESETRRLRKDYGLPDSYVSIGAISEEDPLMISVSGRDQGGVFWQGNGYDFLPSEFTRLAKSFAALLPRLDYVEATKPWMMLIDNNDLEGLRRWLDAGGDPQAKEEMVIGFSALQWAQSWERHEMVALLLSRGAKPPKPWWKFWA